ncbi:alpha-1,2-mannosyltransferase [Catenulispora sp. GP43]|uniref:glycosyltransferase 87 family protein n=1 Tax=Catenulispora sp. GP43 TaxID=3156263 RepID=UPI003513E865
MEEGEVAVRRTEIPAVDWLLALAIASCAALVAHLVYGTADSGSDLAVYHGGASAVAHGHSLYAFASYNGLQFTYPPFAAVFLVPIGLLPIGAAVPVWAAVCTLALEATVWIVLGAVGVRGRRRALFAAAGTVAAFSLAPISSNFWTGQINTILMLLIVADLARPGGQRQQQQRRWRWRGVGVGIAAGLKLTPLIFVPYLLFSRQVRAGVTAAATFAATVLAGFAVMPGGSWRYWRHDVWSTKRIIPVDDAWGFDQSILGAFKRVRNYLPATPLWLVLAVVTGVVGLALAIRASRHGEELTGVVICAITGLLVSPVSWPFHWVWCVPLLILGAARAWRDGLTREKAGVVALWLAFALASIWTFAVFFLDPGNPGPVLVTLFADLFVLIGLGMLAVLAYRTVSSR